MSKPNIFDYATSELSQDAVLAYMLAWAHPDHKETTKLHKLGQDLLFALLSESEIAIEKIGPESEETRKDEVVRIKEAIRQIKKGIKTVEVKRQDNNIDVSVDINGSLFVIIEDKTETIRHGDQIRRYKDEAKKRGHEAVLAVYLKTGNESVTSLPAPERASCFLRDDLLEVLNNNENTNNSIIEEFRTYLQNWEDDTQSFRTSKVSKWSDGARQGYYLYLEKQLEEEGKKFGNYGWCYTNNPGGGFLEFWWVPSRFGLQIRNCETLFIRVTEVWKDEKQIQVDPDIRWQLWEQIEQVAAHFDGIEVTRSGRAGGWSATIAQIRFDESERGSCLVTNDGRLDSSASVERVRMAIRFLDEVREKVSI
ncbi:MAG: PD-(D/E)XK nuclease family protein [Gammaproteobacteria bacterium]|nr:PD-(D/E)XK nuclease family protein [Gammaproteobacteria bacterium]